MTLTADQMTFAKEIAGAITNALAKMGKEPTIEVVTALIPAAMEYIMEKNRKDWEENKDQIVADIYEMLKNK